MGKHTIPYADTISAEDFNEYLAKYEDCIKTISASKACEFIGSASGDRTLTLQKQNQETRHWQNWTSTATEMQ